MPALLEPLDEPESSFPFAALHEVNERCIELLVHAARSEKTPPFAMVIPLRDALRESDPASRRRAALRGFLLVDMGFEQSDWWRMLKHDGANGLRSERSLGHFPRRTGVSLARATLMLAWHSVHADPDAALAVLGLHREVAAAIGSMQLADIDRIADRQFRRVRPRWADRPSIWRAILLSAQIERAALRRDADFHALQLLAGDALARGMHRDRRAAHRQAPRAAGL